MSVGRKLRSLRVNSKKTLKEQSQLFGVSLNSVYRWEHDLTMPKRSVLRKMAEHYDVPYEWLRSENDFGHRPVQSDKQKVEEFSEDELIKKFRKLSGHNRFRVLGYMERLYVESLELETEVPFKFN
jgi:transcriptional regulator with XRE-family HTH domain